MCVTITDAVSLPGNPATYSAIAASLSAIAAFLSATAAFLSYRVNKSSLASKLTDRLYDLDKLILSNAAHFQVFVNLTASDTSKYFDPANKDGRLVKHKAFAYYYLNLFDEIFEAYGRRCSSDDTWKAWQHYMFERIKHPLVKELLLRECGLEIVNEKPVMKAGGNGTSVFSGRFVKFLIVNYANWKEPCSDVFW